MWRRPRERGENVERLVVSTRNEAEDRGRSLGARSFGGMPTRRMILQKGDNFRMSQKPGPQRYVTPTVKGFPGPDGGQAVFEEISEAVPVR